MALSIDDIIELVRNKQAELPNGQLVENQVAPFVEEMQGWIKNMDFSLPEGATIIAYSGEANTDFAWEVAKKYRQLQVIMLFILEILHQENY